jgi:hypothetical protein
MSVTIARQKASTHKAADKQIDKNKTKHFHIPGLQYCLFNRNKLAESIFSAEAVVQAPSNYELPT